MLLRWWIPLLCLSIALPAEAGLRASYAVEGEATPLTIEIADNGDAVLGMGEDGGRLFLIGNDSYIVMDTEEGVKAVRISDVVKAVKTSGMPLLDEPLPALPPPPRVRFEPVGTRRVGGVDGTVYAIRTSGAPSAGGGEEIVASRETSLRPLGHALTRALDDLSTFLPLLGNAGEAASRWGATLREIGALGTPLAMSGALRLTAIETVDVPADHVTLPVQPTDAAELIERMRGMTRGE